MNYLRFLNTVHSMNCQLNNAGVGQVAICLLENIAIAEFRGSHLTVSKAMNMSAIASPATIHRKLNLLLSHGFIKHVYKNSNRRTKYLALTEIANEYLEMKGNAMRIAFQQNQPHLEFTTQLV